METETLPNTGRGAGPGSERGTGGAGAGCGATNRWPLERALFAMAGTVTLVSAVLAAAVSPWFLLLTGFVGLNQWLYVAVGNCPASLVMRRLGLRPSAEGSRA